MFVAFQWIHYDVIFREVGGSWQTFKFAFTGIFFIFNVRVVCERGSLDPSSYMLTETRRQEEARLTFEMLDICALDQ